MFKESLLRYPLAFWSVSNGALHKLHLILAGIIKPAIRTGMHIRGQVIHIKDKRADEGVSYIIAKIIGNVILAKTLPV